MQDSERRPASRATQRGWHIWFLENGICVRAADIYAKPLGTTLVPAQWHSYCKHDWAWHICCAAQGICVSRGGRICQHMSFLNNGICRSIGTIYAQPLASKPDSPNRRSSYSTLPCSRPNAEAICPCQPNRIFNLC